MLIRGDIKRDGVEVEIVSGELSSIQAAKPHTAAKLFTGGLGATLLGAENATQLTLDGANFPAWIDNERVAFICEDERGVHKVAAVNDVTNQWTMLPKPTTDVTHLGIGSPREIVYAEKQPDATDRNASRLLTRSTHNTTKHLPT